MALEPATTPSLSIGWVHLKCTVKPHILVQTNDIYFAVTMLTLYVADIQTVQPDTLSLDGPNTQLPKRHIHIWKWGGGVINEYP